MSFGYSGLLRIAFELKRVFEPQFRFLVVQVESARLALKLLQGLPVGYFLRSPRCRFLPSLRGLKALESQLRALLVVVLNLRLVSALGFLQLRYELRPPPLIASADTLQYRGYLLKP